MQRRPVEATGTVELEVGPLNASGARVVMRDHGPGVPSEIRDRIFDPYVTAQGRRHRSGLALVRQTIENHGGTIRLEDTPGGGATFVVELAGRKMEDRRRETGNSLKRKAGRSLRHHLPASRILIPSIFPFHLCLIGF